MALLALIYWIVTRKAPAGDHGIRLKAEPLPPECQGKELYRTARAAEGFFDRALLEKIVLTGLISVIFAQYLVSDDVKSIASWPFVATSWSSTPSSASGWRAAAASGARWRSRCS